VIRFAAICILVVRCTIFQEEEVYEFFAFLDETSIKLVDKEHVVEEKQNAVESALEKMSKCKKLKNLYFTMLNKCEVDKKCASIMEKKFVYYRKWLKNTCVRGKKKTEIKIYTHPKKKTQSSFTRGEINAKCKERKIA
jgi:hypothetical protein